MASSAKPFDEKTGQRLITPVDPKATPAPIFSAGGSKPVGKTSDGTPYSVNNIPPGSSYNKDGSIVAPDGTVIQAASGSSGSGSKTGGGTSTDGTGGTTGYPRVTPAASTTPIGETAPLTPPIQAPVVPTEDQVYQGLLSQSSDLIKGTTDKYNMEIDRATSNANAVAASEGLAGSTVAGGMSEAAAAPLLAQRSIDLGNIYETIRKDAQSLQQQDFVQGEQTYQDKLAAQQLAYTNATKSISAMAAAHVDWNSYKQSNPDNYNALVQSVGGDPNVADAMFSMSIPPPNILSTTMSADGTTAIVVSQDPVTGKVQSSSYTLSIPIPTAWTSDKLGTNATRYKAPNYNPTDPSTYIDVTSDPSNGGAITQIVGGKTYVNGVEVNNTPGTSGTSGTGSNATTSYGDAVVKTTASKAGVSDVTMSMSDIIDNANVGVQGVTNGIIAQEGGSPKGVVNNPGNIAYDPKNPLPGSKDSGVAIQGGNGLTFASFDTKEQGINGVNGLVQKAADKGMSFQDFIAQYKGVKTTAQANELAHQMRTSSNVVDNTAQQLVDGTIAPSQLSKRSTGTNSYPNIIAKAVKLGEQEGKPFDAEKADQQFSYGKANATQATQAALGYTTDTLQQLKGLSSDVERGSITYGNQAGEWLSYKGSDPATVDFITKANGAIDDVSAALGGGVSTDMKTQIAKTLLDPTLSDTAFKSQIDTDLGTIASRQFAIAKQAGQTADSTVLEIYAAANGYDYSAMKAAGHTDDEIQKALEGN